MVEEMEFEDVFESDNEERKQISDQEPTKSIIKNDISQANLVEVKTKT